MNVIEITDHDDYKTKMRLHREKSPQQRGVSTSFSMSKMQQ